MLKITNKDEVKLIEETKKLIEDVRCLEKKRDELKKKILDWAGDETTISAGNLIVLINNCERSSLDIDKVRTICNNDEELDALMKTTKFKTMSIKLA